MGKPERLNRYLSRCGLASRRKADELIASGRVAVDGQAVGELGRTIDPLRASVTVDGKPVRPPARFRYYAFNKPAGYLCSRGDPYGRPTIYELLPSGLRTLKYVGRLDFDTEGLLLMTDDGGLIEKLTHPKHGLVRVYLAGIAGTLSDGDLAPLRRGVSFQGESYRPARARLVSPRGAGRGSVVRVEISEGKKREVRMLFRAVGRQVLWLRRLEFGPVSLGALPPGGHRPLDGRELDMLKGKRPA